MYLHLITLHCLLDILYFVFFCSLSGFIVVIHRRIGYSRSYLMMLAVIVLVLIFFIISYFFFFYYYLLFHTSMQGNRKRGARSFKNWGWWVSYSEWHVSSILGNADIFAQISTVALYVYVCVYLCVCMYVYRKGVLNYILQHLFITFYPQYILILSPVLSESNRSVVIWMYLNVHKITRLQINYFIISYFIPL